MVVLGTMLVGTGTTAFGWTDSRIPPPLPIAAGSTHTLFQRPNGKLYVWGDNSYGQLGLGNTTSKVNPTLASFGGALTIAAGSQFSMAIDAQGALYTWGRNTEGQLGQGTVTTTPSTYASPTRVGTDTNWRFIAAGSRHAMAIKMDGTLWAWGDNARGQLGADVPNQSSPRKIGTFTDWIAIAAGDEFSVALRANGNAYTTGRNNVGQLGLNDSGITSVKVMTKVGSRVWRAIDAGAYHVVAIQYDGALYSWGWGDKGQIGSGSAGASVISYEPVKRGSLLWRSIAAGHKHSLGIAANGQRYVWGENASGELGLGNTTQKNSPTTGGSAGADSELITAGKSFSMAISGRGDLTMWGAGSQGQLGIGSGITTKTSPTRPFTSFAGDPFAGDTKPGLMSGGSRHSAAIRSNGFLETWGSNADLTLGPYDGGSQLSPGIRVTGNDWMALATGETQTLAVKANGTLWGWGKNQLGEVGSTPDRTAVPNPTQVGTDNGWYKAAAHYAVSFGIKVDGSLYGWGDNGIGQTGTGDTMSNPRVTPTQVAAGKTFVAVAPSAKNAYGITADGKLWAWGSNHMGQLGNGLSGDTRADARFTPIQVGTAQTWIAVGAGEGFVIAQQANGKLFGWGVNTDYHELGNSSLGTMVKTPTALYSTQVFRQLAVTRFSTLVSGPGGFVRGWGGNISGELGAGHRNVVQTISDTTFYYSRALYPGSGHVLEIEPFSGLRMGAGQNVDGQIGDGTQVSPVYMANIPPGYN